MNLGGMFGVAKADEMVAKNATEKVSSPQSERTEDSREPWWEEECSKQRGVCGFIWHLKEERLAAEALEAARMQQKEEEQVQAEALRPIELPTFSCAGHCRRAPGWVRAGDMVPASLAGLPEHFLCPPSPPPRAPSLPPLADSPPPPMVEDCPDTDDSTYSMPPVTSPPKRFGVYCEYNTVPQHDPKRVYLSITSQTSRPQRRTNGAKQHTHPLPKAKIKHVSEDAAPTFEVNNIIYRPLLASIKAAYDDTVAARYHHIPFKLFAHANPATITAQQGDLDPIPSSSSESFSIHHLPPHPLQQLFLEACNLDALCELNDAIQLKAKNDHKQDDPPDLEYTIAPIGLYSDSTHLTNLGTASRWPIYFWILGLSKYIHAMPSSFSTHHLAYIPSVRQDVVTQAYEQAYGTPPTAAVLRFCKKELFQQIWLILLNDNFVEAYVHGFVIKCADRITQRLFPRILTYSADYPKKCLIACIKYLGRCPCPDCLVSRDKIHLMGTKNDMANCWIFWRGVAPEGKRVEGLLGETSTSAMQSAFSRRLVSFGFNIYCTLVPDVMHEVELSVWKSTLMHLVCILVAQGASTVNMFNARFANVPTFGRDTICRFDANIAGLKKLAARDFKDLLQCAIPIFEHLLEPPHNHIVHHMLFQLAMFHVCAKLHMHSNNTLHILEHLIGSLGQAMCVFTSNVCPDYNTWELDKEVEARQWRQARKSLKSKGPGQAQDITPSARSKGHVDCPRKDFNLNTYKFHHLGDHTTSAHLVGSLDGPSTVTGKLEHRHVKHFYVRTNKNFQFGLQITRHKHRKCIEPEDTSSSSPNVHTEISEELCHPLKINGFIHDNKGDLAVKDFIPKLHHHVYAWLVAGAGSPPDRNLEPTGHKLASLRIRHNQLISTRCHPGIMLLAEPGSVHPYIYACVLGMFHVSAYIAGRSNDEPMLVQVLWIRWYNFDKMSPWGPESRRLPLVSFAPLDNNSFGFISLDQVLHSVHLILAFAHGLSDAALPGYSITCLEDEEDEDFCY
ncbi:hypothetical protein NUW54_g25 [Trametes sanguinea]|uniref:Uncharacterized protein n=1 Tax=Trametes sanguinea TaxID=158606 RepID=A0ACC1QAW9_9APHY|nr:hypothetical protein NUW54_g25 [Trametes sanguinea]